MKKYLIGAAIAVAVVGIAGGATERIVTEDSSSESPVLEFTPDAVAPAPEAAPLPEVHVRPDTPPEVFEEVPQEEPATAEPQVAEAPVMVPQGDPNEVAAPPATTREPLPLPEEPIAAPKQVEEVPDGS